jgi:SAM-dependent methyltransferase
MYKNLSQIKAAEVSDVGSYNARMRRSLIDKVFFLDKVGDASIFVDYGCADGSVLKLAHTLVPTNAYIGYDNSKEMIEAAKKNCSGMFIEFTDKIEELNGKIDKMSKHNGKVCLSLLSLIHEIYSYGPEKVREFWGSVFNPTCYDYIAIRDMCVSRTTSRPSDPLSVAKIRMKYDKGMLAQWEAQWGSLSENWSLVHFLLTYSYVDSWDRELRENYLPLPMEDLLNLIPDGWDPIYLEHYTLPYIRQQVLVDFGVDLQDRTHLKLILRKKSK